MSKQKYKTGDHVEFILHPKADKFSGVIIQKEDTENGVYYDIMLFNELISMHEDSIELLEDEQE